MDRHEDCVDYSIKHIRESIGQWGIHPSGWWMNAVEVLLDRIAEMEPIADYLVRDGIGELHDWIREDAVRFVGLVREANDAKGE